jgi:hypothetical protein
MFDDDDSDGFVDLNDMPEAKSTDEETVKRRGKMKQRLSRSLSPKTFGRNMLGRRDRSTDRSGEDQNEDQGNKPLRRRPRSMDRSGEHVGDQGGDPPQSPKPLRRRSRSTTGLSQSLKANPQRSKSTDVYDDVSQSPKRRPPIRAKSIHTKLRRAKSVESSPGNGQDLNHSVSPRRKLKRFVGGETEPGFDGMRKSLLADKKQLDDLQHKFDQEGEPPDDETLMERVARRVAAKRRGKMIERSKTDGDDIAAMQMALKARQEREREDDEGIGGIWAKGLKALEKVYDDIS